MSSFNFKYIHNSDDSHSPSSENKSFWQSPLWINILTKTNQADIIVGSNDRTQIVIERRKIWGKYTGLYILGVNPDVLTKEFLQELREIVLTPTDLFLQIEPLASQANYTFLFEFFQKNAAPFRRFIEPVTALLNLTTPETELMASFTEKGRYNIRLAQKR